MNARLRILPSIPLIAWALFACGERPLHIPPPLPSPTTLSAVDSNRPDGTTALRDRNLGRTGFSCADCHPVEKSVRLRPGPSIQTATPTQIHHCVERYLGRSALSTTTMESIVGAARQIPRRDRNELGPNERLYDAGCRHCHEGGPAGPLLGLPFQTKALSAIIRGENRSPHPRTLMPPFSTSALPDSHLKAIVQSMVFPTTADDFDDQ